jgi:hypothetical protein
MSGMLCCLSAVMAEMSVSNKYVEVEGSRESSLLLNKSRTRSSQ